MTGGEESEESGEGIIKFVKELREIILKGARKLGGRMRGLPKTESTGRS
jgi:hypothetical protein